MWLRHSWPHSEWDPNNGWMRVQQPVSQGCFCERRGLFINFTSVEKSLIHWFSLSFLKNYILFNSVISFFTGEGNGNPLQCSCLENSMDRGTCVFNPWFYSPEIFTFFFFSVLLLRWSTFGVWVLIQISSILFCILRCCTNLQVKSLTAAVREPGSLSQGATSQNTETPRFAAEATQ